MKNFSIDINCDVGEGIGNEGQLLPLISSCNIACGGHAGDLTSLKEVLLLAKQHDVKAGAHPSYPDKENFGRVTIPISEDDLMATIQYQVENFVIIAKKENIKMHHIKLHGALYNDVAKDIVLARIFLRAIARYKESVYIYVPFASVIEKEALKQGFHIKSEAFADRNYNADLSLVSRKLANAVLEDPRSVLDHLLLMVKEKQVQAVNGELIPMDADTFCVHGDTTSALQILTYLTKQLQTQNIEIA